MHFKALPPGNNVKQPRSACALNMITFSPPFFPLVNASPRSICCGQIRYMVSNGFDVHFHAISEAVHWVVSGCDEATDGDASKPALKFLANEAGMSINLQARAFASCPSNSRRSILTDVAMCFTTTMYWDKVVLLHRGHHTRAVACAAVHVFPRDGYPAKKGLEILM